MTGEQWTRVAGLDELGDGVPAGCEVGGNPVVLVRKGDDIHACGGKCAHYGAPLKEGLVIGDEIVCPWHCARYALATGKRTRHPALTGVGCYMVKVEGGDVFVGRKRHEERETAGGGDTRTFVTIGAGAAGNACAEELRVLGFTGRLIMITAEEDLPYDRPSLSKEFMAGTAKPEWLPLRSDDFYANLDVELMAGQRVVSLDVADKVVRFEDGEVLAFDRALLATGGVPRKLDMKGGDLDGVFLLRSLADAKRIVKTAESAKAAVVVGAGFIGMEVAASLRERGLEVHVVAPEEVPMVRVFRERIGRRLQSAQEDEGVVFHMGQTVAEVRGDGKAEEVLLSGGSTVRANLVIIGAGIRPAVDYLADSALVVDGAVPVDACLETKAEGIFAAGDIAVVPDARLGRGIRVEHWTVAEMQGRYAAAAMLGHDEGYRNVPFFWTKQGEASVKYAGFASQADAVAFRGNVEGGKFLAGFYNGDGQLTAIASAGMNHDFIACAELLERGQNVPMDILQDADADLPAMLEEG